MSILHNIWRSLGRKAVHYGEGVSQKKHASLRKEVEEDHEQLRKMLTKIASLQTRLQSMETALPQLWHADISASLAERERASLPAEISSFLLKRFLESAPLEDGHAPEPHACPTLEEGLARLRQKAPRSFDLWQGTFAAGEEVYEGLPVNSCSVAGHGMAESFRWFVRSFVTGPVLDVGCGPQPKPLYLQDVPDRLIAGLDPLSASENLHPFVFAQGLGEFLPWDDGAFQSVVIATSLDHVFLLDRSLEEVKRALRPGGVFLNWVAFVPGSVPYDPFDPAMQPVDHFHLFHFDQPWYEELLSRYFEKQHSIHLNGSSFYAWRTPT